jgi:hypothetical protein
MARATYFVDHDAGLELNEQLLNVMDDSETSQMLDELNAFVSSGSWDLSFLDDDKLAGQEFRSSFNVMQQSPDTFRQPLEQMP